MKYLNKSVLELHELLKEKKIKWMIIHLMK